MATTSTTTSTLREYYDWDSADFTWDAQQCNEHINLFGIYDHTQESKETALISECRYSAVRQERTTQIGVSENVNKRAVRKNLLEVMGVSETYWDKIGYVMNFIESLQLLDQTKHDVAKVGKDRFSIHEMHAVSAGKKIVETVIIAEILLREFKAYRQYDEDLSLTDIIKQVFSKWEWEELSVDEDYTRKLTQSLQELFTMAEAATHKSVVKRSTDEVVEILDGYAGSYADYQNEEIQLAEAFLRACQGVLADMGIYHGGITLDDFKRIIKQPSGYEPFIPYVVGDYEYEKALVRLLVKAGSMGSQPAVYDAVINVDIDDTVDRGTVDITDTSAATKVYFNKHYYTKPEVAVTLQGGNTVNGVITPNIVAISSDDDGYYFTVELLRSDGTRVPGRITWNSVGY